MKRTWRVTAILGMATVVLAGLATAVGAATYENATARGWYDSRGRHDPTNLNYCVGWGCGVVYDERNFFVFNMSGYSAQAADFGVSFARVVLTNPSGSGAPVPYQLRNVSTPISELTAAHLRSPVGRSIFGDLGSGKLYGSTTPGAMTDNPIQVDLNGEGLLALTKVLGKGKVAFGGSLKGGGATDLLFGNSLSVPSSGIELQFQLGDKTSMTLKGPGRVARGSRVTYRGKVTSASAACVNGVELQITVGTRHSTVTTKADGSYAFKARIMRTTRLRAFYPGTVVVSPTDPCGGSETRKTVRLS